MLLSPGGLFPLLNKDVPEVHLAWFSLFFIE